MSTFSVTVSPKERDDFEIKMFIASIEVKGAKYVIGDECGKKGHPHWQIGIQTEKNVRRDNFKKRWILPFCHFAITKASLCVKEHQDPKYLLGYCQKEGQYLTNIKDVKLLQECRDYYDKGVGIFEPKCPEKYRPKEQRLSVDEICDLIVDWHQKMGYLAVDDGTWDNCMIHIVKKIKFSVYQKINKEKMYEFVKYRLANIKYEPAKASEISIKHDYNDIDIDFLDDDDISRGMC